MAFQPPLSLALTTAPHITSAPFLDWISTLALLEQLKGSLSRGLVRVEARSDGFIRPEDIF